MLKRLKFDMQDTVDMVLNMFSPDTWKSSTSTFLDPAMGGGQITRVIEKILRDHGHSDDNIKSRVFGIESEAIYVPYAVRKYNLVGTYINTDFLSWEPNMKFDNIVGNPPYKGGMHIDFFNKCFDMLNDGGNIIFIHPSTPLINRKSVFENENIKKIKNIVSEYNTRLTLVNGNDIFDINQEAPLSITHVKKEKSQMIEMVNNYYSENNNVVTYDSLDDIYIHSNPLVTTIKNKIDSMGYESMEDNLYRSKKTYKNYLLKLNSISTGTPTNNAPSGKFQCIISKKYENCFDELLFTEKSTENTSNEVLINTREEAFNCFNYLLTKFARFALSIYKINQHLDRGELKIVPFLDFTQEWTDEKLFNHFNLTKEEKNFINEYIQDWYERDFIR